MLTTPHVSPGSLSLTAPSPSFSEQSAFTLSTTAPHLLHHRPHPLPTPAHSPTAAAGNSAAVAPVAPLAPTGNPPELGLSPISKGFVGKGPRSRPSSARPHPLSAAGELPQALDGQLEPSSGHNQLSSGPAHSTASHSHPSIGNGNSSNGQAFPSTSGDGGHQVTTELTARLSSGGRSSGGGDGQGLTKRRSRSLSLSRDPGEGLEAPPQQQQGVGRATPEPEVQQASTAAEGPHPPLVCLCIITCVLPYSTSQPRSCFLTCMFPARLSSICCCCCVYFHYHLSLLHSMHCVQHDLPTVYVLLLYLCYSLHAWLHIMNLACNCT